eukprot:jgi/Mesvir1/29607/Mv21462-RA.1
MATSRHFQELCQDPKLWKRLCERRWGKEGFEGIRGFRFMYRFAALEGVWRSVDDDGRIAVFQFRDGAISGDILAGSANGAWRKSFVHLTLGPDQGSLTACLCPPDEPDSCATCRVERYSWQDAADSPWYIRMMDADCFVIGCPKLKDAGSSGIRASTTTLSVARAATVLPTPSLADEMVEFMSTRVAQRSNSSRSRQAKRAATRTGGGLAGGTGGVSPARACPGATVSSVQQRFLRFALPEPPMAHTPLQGLWQELPSAAPAPNPQGSPPRLPPLAASLLVVSYKDSTCTCTRLSGDVATPSGTLAWEVWTPSRMGPPFRAPGRLDQDTLDLLASLDQLPPPPPGEGAPFMLADGVGVAAMFAGGGGGGRDGQGRVGMDGLNDDADAAVAAVMAPGGRGDPDQADQGWARGDALQDGLDDAVGVGQRGNRPPRLGQAAVERDDGNGPVAMAQVQAPNGRAGRLLEYASGLLVFVFLGEHHAPLRMQRVSLDSLPTTGMDEAYVSPAALTVPSNGIFVYQQLNANHNAKLNCQGGIYGSLPTRPCKQQLSVAGGIVAPLNWRWSYAEAESAALRLSPIVVLADESCEPWVGGLLSACAGLRHAVLLREGAPPVTTPTSPDAITDTENGAAHAGDELSHPLISTQPQLQTRTHESLRPPRVVAYEELLCRGAAGGPRSLAKFELRSNPKGTALICFTSGSSGKEPKGAVLSHRALHVQSRAKIDALGYSADDVYVHTAPLFHIGGISSALAMLAAGARHVFLPQPTPVALLGALRSHAATSFIAVPAMLVDLVALMSAAEATETAAKAAADAAELSSRRVIGGAEPRVQIPGERSASGGPAATQSDAAAGMLTGVREGVMLRGGNEVAVPRERGGGVSSMLEGMMIDAGGNVAAYIKGVAAPRETRRESPAAVVSVRMILVGGAALSQDLTRSMARHFPCAFLSSAYGLTEAASSLTFRLESAPCYCLTPQTSGGLATRPSRTTPMPSGWLYARCSPSAPDRSLTGGIFKAGLVNAGESNGACAQCHPCRCTGPLPPSGSTGEGIDQLQAGLGTCVGRPPPHVELFIATDTADEALGLPSVPAGVAPGQGGTSWGNVWTRGPHVMDGYWGGADVHGAGAGSTVPPPVSPGPPGPGWLDTGDVGRIDGHGQLWLFGRRSDVIRSGSEGVRAVEVEGALVGHPGVAAAAVVGVPDARLGEAVAALIVLAPGWRWRPAGPGGLGALGDAVSNGMDAGIVIGEGDAGGCGGFGGGDGRMGVASGEISAEDLREHCRHVAKLSRFKVPKVLVAQAEPLPCTSLGKVKKAEVRDLIIQAIGLAFPGSAEMAHSTPLSLSGSKPEDGKPPNMPIVSKL